MERPHDDPPWSIPIREAGPEIPHRYATWIDRVPAPPLVAGALVLFALVVGALVVLDGDPAESGPEVLGAQMSGETTVVAPPTSAAATTTSPSTSAATSTSISTSAEAETTTTTTARRVPATSAERAVPADPEPDGLPIHTPGDLGDGWIAQVSSVPSSAGGAALARSYETVRRDVPDALIVRGSEWASLRDGFWVIFHPGHDDAASAVEACEGWGYEGKDDCFARYLSVDDPTPRTCWRDESGSLAGDCA